MTPPLFDRAELFKKIRTATLILLTVVAGALLNLPSGQNTFWTSLTGLLLIALLHGAGLFALAAKNPAGWLWIALSLSFLGWIATLPGHMPSPLTLMFQGFALMCLRARARWLDQNSPNP